MAAASEVRRIKLGNQGLEISAQGLGCMRLSIFEGADKLEADHIALIQHAINSGITLLDTSDVYGPQTNELLLGKVPIFVHTHYSLVIDLRLFWLMCRL